jgi:hypothetical protein
MKTLYYSIISGSAIVAVIFLTLVLVDPNFLTARNFHVVSIQKIVNHDDLWKLIHPIKGENREYLSTEGIDWSDDGRSLAFGVNAGAPVSYLWTMNSNGKELTPANIPIEFNSISDIRISKNDSSVFFVGQYNSGNNTYQDIFRYDANNKSYSFVTKDSHVKNIEFMKNGDILYVEAHSNSTRLEKNTPVFLIKHYNVLWLATPDGYKIKPLYNGTMLFDGMTLNPSGDKIAFVSRDDPNHPESNGTDIVNFSSLGPSNTHNYQYFTIFDVTTKEFTVMEKTDNEEFASMKWLPDGDHILYEKLTHHCVQDRMPGTQSCPAGLLELMSISEHSSQVIYGNQAEPYTTPLVGTAISLDGRSIIFGVNYDFTDDRIDGKGIYKMTFDKPLYLKN